VTDLGYSLPQRDYDDGSRQMDVKNNVGHHYWHHKNNFGRLD